MSSSTSVHWTAGYIDALIESWKIRKIRKCVCVCNMQTENGDVMRSHLALPGPSLGHRHANCHANCGVWQHCNVVMCCNVMQCMPLIKSAL